MNLKVKILLRLVMFAFVSVHVLPASSSSQVNGSPVSPQNGDNDRKTKAILNADKTERLESFVQQFRNDLQQKGFDPADIDVAYFQIKEEPSYAPWLSKYLASPLGSNRAQKHLKILFKYLEQKVGHVTENRNAFRIQQQKQQKLDDVIAKFFNNHASRTYQLKIWDLVQQQALYSYLKKGYDDAQPGSGEEGLFLDAILDCLHSSKKTVDKQR